MVSHATKMYPICVDMGPEERWRHAGRTLVLMAKNGPLLARNMEEHLLDHLRMTGWLSIKERDAGQRFQQDFHLAGLEARLTSGYNPTRGSFSFFGPWDERSDKEEEAYQRWRAALRIMARYGDAVISCACHEQTPSPRQALQVKQGLKILAAWYGL